MQPEGEYGRRANGEWVAVARYPDETFEERKPGAELVGWRYTGPFDELAPGAAVEHRVIAWDEVSLDEGTGIVHIAPGCGHRGLRARASARTCRCSTPVDEAGRFYDDYGWLHGLSTVEAADQIIGNLGERGFLVEAGLYEHRYPHCWRCDTPLIFRIADDWFISVARSAAADARRERRRSSGRPSTWASAWTTGCTTWATGTSRGAATTGCRCRSIRARAGT